MSKIFQKILHKLADEDGHGDKPTTAGSKHQHFGPPGRGQPASDTAPQIPGFAMVWSDDFNGPAGAGVDRRNWQFFIGKAYNNEIERYTDSTANTQLSGNGEVRIIPLRNPQTGEWTSGRIEGNKTFACDPGHQMILQARVRLGTNPPAQQQGIWPAFWAMGRELRVQGIGWPRCGEWDILEPKNGVTQNWATVHYGVDANSHQMGHQPGGSTFFSPGDYHVYQVLVDRKTAPGQETLTWFMDGQQYFQVRQADVNPPYLWDNLAHNEYLALFNVAIGGDYPGPPNAQTLDGPESGMQVSYVAFYKSNT